MNLFVLMVIAFTSGWGFMDIMRNHTRFPDWLRFCFLLIFAWAVAVAVTL